MRPTFENHLTGVSTDKPHPLSEYAHLPLNTDDPICEAIADAKEAAYHQGYTDGERAAEAHARRIATVRKVPLA